MQYRDLTLLLIKLAGAFLIVYAIVGIPSYITSYFSLRLDDDSILIFFSISIFPFLVPLAAGIMMFRFPSTITNRFVKLSDSNDGDSFSSIELQLVAFSTLGLYLLFRVVSDFSYLFSFIYLIDGDTFQERLYLIDTYSRIFATVFELIFAMYLLFGSNSLVKLIASIRSIGIK